MGNLYFFNRLVIDYGYCLDLLTISLGNSRVFCFPSELRLILLRNIVDITVFLCLLELPMFKFCRFFSKSNSLMGNFAHNSENYLVLY